MVDNFPTVIETYRLAAITSSRKREMYETIGLLKQLSSDPRSAHVLFLTLALEFIVPLFLDGAFDTGPDCC